MEFLLPSLIALLAGAFIVLGIFPKLGPLPLVGIAIVSLVLVVHHHMTLFELEYKELAITDMLKHGGSTVLVVLVAVLAIGYLLLMKGFVSGATSYIPEVPSLQASEIPRVPNASRTNGAANRGAGGNAKNGRSLGNFFSKYA